MKTLHDVMMAADNQPYTICYEGTTVKGKWFEDHMLDFIAKHDTLPYREEADHMLKVSSRNLVRGL